MMPEFKVHFASLEYQSGCQGEMPPPFEECSSLRCGCGSRVGEDEIPYLQTGGPQHGLMYRRFKCRCGTSVFIPQDWPQHEIVVAHDTAKAIFCDCTPLM